jgi:glycosyltransferase involved in cell wall biosynthesis
MPRLKRLATELRVSQHINFRGFVSDSELRAAYAACDVFVLPSAKEGFCLVYLEAMAECKPVVAANAGGVPDVVVDGETGVLIPPGDVGALTEALLTLLDNPEMQRQLGAAGAARVQTHFSFEQFVQRLGRALALPSGGGSC